MSEEQQRRNKNALRFAWHEKVLADREVRKRPNAMALAGYVMHHFNVDLGYAQFSINGVARKLGMHRSTAIRCRDLLIKQGWIQVFERPIGPGGWHLTLRYSLAGGPEDLVLECHGSSDAT